jgi:hypothetical protein
MLLCAVFFVLPDVYAQTGDTDEETVTPAEAQTVEKKKSEAVKPVEAGPGGGLKLETEYRTEVESQYKWHAHMLWESRYVTEGRDNLQGDGLVSISSEFNLGEAFTIIPWLADSPDTDYSEFNLSFIGGTRLTEHILLYAGYTWLYARAEAESANDDEISLGMDYDWTENLGAAAVVYHSFLTSGTFMEMTVRYGEILGQEMDYSIQAILGANDGYVIEGHDGLNHFQLRAYLNYHPVTNVEFYALAGYSQAIDKDVDNNAEDESLGNFVWGGIGFIYLF